GLANIQPHEVQMIAEYLEANFGPNSKLPVDRLPPEPIDEKSLNIRFESFDIPTMNAKPHTAIPDGKGNVWFSEMGGSKVGVVHLATGKMEEFSVPREPFPRPHGITLDPSGNVWFAVQGQGTIGRLDAQTKALKYYKVPPAQNLV